MKCAVKDIYTRSEPVSRPRHRGACNYKTGILLPSNRARCDDRWKPPCPHWRSTRWLSEPPPLRQDASPREIHERDPKVLPRLCAGNQVTGSFRKCARWVKFPRHVLPVFSCHQDPNTALSGFPPVIELCSNSPLAIREIACLAGRCRRMPDGGPCQGDARQPGQNDRCSCIASSPVAALPAGAGSSPSPRSRRVIVVELLSCHDADSLVPHQVAGARPGTGDNGRWPRAGTGLPGVGQRGQPTWMRGLRAGSGSCLRRISRTTGGVSPRPRRR